MPVALGKPPPRITTETLKWCYHDRTSSRFKAIELEMSYTWMRPTLQTALKLSELLTIPEPDIDVSDKLTCLTSNLFVSKCHVFRLWHNLPEESQQISGRSGLGCHFFIERREREKEGGNKKAEMKSLCSFNFMDRFSSVGAGACCINNVCSRIEILQQIHKMCFFPC